MPSYGWKSLSSHADSGSHGWKCEPPLIYSVHARAFALLKAQVFNKTLDQGFDQGLGKGKKLKYSVQFYPSSRKNP